MKEKRDLIKAHPTKASKNGEKKKKKKHQDVSVADSQSIKGWSEDQGGGEKGGNPFAYKKSTREHRPSN